MEGRGVLTRREELVDRQPLLSRQGVGHPSSESIDVNSPVAQSRLEGPVVH